MTMSEQNNNHRQPAGFTLVELMISVFILVSVSTIVLANYRAGDRTRRVALAADGVVNAVRLAQNYALAGRQIPTTSCANQAAKNYRISFSSSSAYTVYAQDNCSNNLYVTQAYTLPTNVQMRSGELRLNNSPVGTLSIMFTPPFGNLTASGNGGSFAAFTNASIGVESQGGQTVKTVIVDGVSGRIGE